MKKILILNGSSRPHAFTEALIDSFRQGAESKGNQVEVVHLREKRIHHCLGCLHGGKDYEHPCTQRDDMDEIYRLYRQSDVIVLATPLFFWSYSGLLKDALDRLWALAEQSVDELHGNNKSGLLLCAAGGSHPQPLIDHFDYLMKRMEWANLGHYVLCHTDDMDKRNIPEIAGAIELGEKVAQQSASGTLSSGDPFTGQIIDTAGKNYGTIRTSKATAARDLRTLRLPHGLYIIRTGSSCFKVLVK